MMTMKKVTMKQGFTVAIKNTVHDRQFLNSVFF